MVNYNVADMAVQWPAVLGYKLPERRVLRFWVEQFRYKCLFVLQMENFWYWTKVTGNGLIGNYKKEIPMLLP